MKNEFWIFCKTKKCYELVIDIYDDKYMEQSREERFSKLKNLLANDIMEIKIVNAQWSKGYLPRMSLEPEHKEGDIYIKNDGEAYTIVYNTERRVCELVWEAFQGEIPQGFRVCHIDGNKQNNRLDNLKLDKEQ